MVRELYLFFWITLYSHTKIYYVLSTTYYVLSGRYYKDQTQLVGLFFKKGVLEFVV